MNPAISQFQRSIEEAQTARARLFEQIAADTRRLLPLLIADLFTLNPTLELVAWTQFEGEYNDEGPYPGLQLTTVRLAGETHDEYYGRGGSSAAQAMMQAVGTVLQQIDEEVAFSIFGGYNWVVATRAGIQSLDNVDLYDEVDWDETYAELMAAMTP